MTLLQNTTLAESQAAANFAANRSVLRALQPSLDPWIAEQYLAVEWVFARDRSLTALDEAGQWWSGCSVPACAAEAIFSRIEVRGAVGCFLNPSNAAQVRAVLDKLRKEQAIIAVVTDMRDLAMLLHCENFADAIADHRLWFAAGPAWEIGLRQLLEEQTGLAQPAQFVRSSDADKSTIEEMIAAAQKVFSEIGIARAARIQQLRLGSSPQSSNASGSTKLCVLAPANFRLWSDLGSCMLQIFHEQAGFEIKHFNTDDPASSSPLALVEASLDADVIFTANSARSDLPGLVPDRVRWISWITAPRIPSSSLAGENDHLIVTDPALQSAAIKASWPTNRVHLGSFPTTAAKSNPNGPIGILADTCIIEAPKDLNDYSSHTLLWASIKQELSRDPFVLLDVQAYLTERMRKFEVSDDAFQPARFIEKLILPAYQQGIARVLIKLGIKLKLFGCGWDRIEEFKAFACGAVQSGDAFRDAVSQCAGLVHVWPSMIAHPIDSASVPIARRTGRRPEPFLAQIKAIVAGKTLPPPAVRQTLSAELLRSICVE